MSDDASITIVAVLVSQLVRRPDWRWDFSRVQQKARKARFELVRHSLQRARDEFVPLQSYGVTKAAKIIAHAVHGRGHDDLQTKLRRFLERELGYLDDVPDWSRIKQLID